MQGRAIDEAGGGPGHGNLPLHSVVSEFSKVVQCGLGHVYLACQVDVHGREAWREKFVRSRIRLVDR